MWYNEVGVGWEGEIMLRAGARNQQGQKRPLAGQGGEVVLGPGTGREGTKHKSASLFLLECVAS